MNNRRSFTKLIGTILGIGLLVALGFIMSGWFRAMRTVNEDAPIPSQSQPVLAPKENEKQNFPVQTTSRSSEPADPMAGWRAYNSEVQGYSVKYPSDWFFASEGEEAFLSKVIYISSYDTKKFYKSFEKGMLKIQLSVNPVQKEEGQAIEKWFAKHPYYGQESTEDRPGLYLHLLETSSKQVGGISALRVLAEEGAPGGLATLIYFIPLPGTKSVLEISAKPGNSEFLGTFELVVSSLKFNR